MCVCSRTCPLLLLLLFYYYYGMYIPCTYSNKGGRESGEDVAPSLQL